MGSDVEARYKTGTTSCRLLSVVSFPPPVSSPRWSGHSRWGGGEGNADRERSGDAVGNLEEGGQIRLSRGSWRARERERGRAFTSSVEEEEARSVGCGHVLGHVADFQVVDEAPEEEQEACGTETPSASDRRCEERPPGRWRSTHLATGRSTRASTGR